ncbi:hypothetical protein [Streptomyces sp. MBT65]|uniref:hypothetical protein n=1 Tax=Streptomyces sp. MBT65 TaxID=1488395 RepID=UPI0027D9CEAD|nr:hypothetical protein [Streptomyces sp. MBT65]
MSIAAQWTRPIVNASRPSVTAYVPTTSSPTPDSGRRRSTTHPARARTLPDTMTTQSPGMGGRGSVGMWGR